MIGKHNIHSIYQIDSMEGDEAQDIFLKYAGVSPYVWVNTCHNTSIMHASGILDIIGDIEFNSGQTNKLTDTYQRLIKELELFNNIDKYIKENGVTALRY